MKSEDFTELIQNSGKVIREHLPKSNDLEIIILKGHTLLEYLMNQIITLKSRYNLETVNNNFTFYHKIEILVILNIIKQNSDIYHILKIWNKTRNQIAHRLDFDRNLVDKLIKLGVKQTKGEEKLPKNDSERAKAMKFLIPSCSGYLTANLAMSGK